MPLVRRGLGGPMLAAGLAFAALPAAAATASSPSPGDLGRLCDEVDTDHLDLRNGRLTMTAPGGQFSLALPGNAWCIDLMAPPHERHLINIAPRWEQQQAGRPIPPQRQHYVALSVEPLVSLPEGGIRAARESFARAATSGEAKAALAQQLRGLGPLRDTRISVGPLENQDTCFTAQLDGQAQIPVPPPKGSPRRALVAWRICAARPDSLPGAVLMFAQEFHPADGEAVARSATYAQVGRQIFASLRVTPGTPGLWAYHDSALGVQISLSARKAAQLWVRHRPADGPGAVRLWGRLCEARGGEVLVPEAQRLAMGGASVAVSGPGWCRIQEPGVLILDGGWVSAEALSNEANRTEAAAQHRFMLAMRMHRPDPDAGDVVEQTRFDMADMVRRLRSLGLEVTGAAMTPDADPRCAGFVLHVTRPAAGADRNLTTTRARACREPGEGGRMVTMTVDEHRLATDPDAEERGRATRAALARTMESLRLDP